jgi:Uncharacterized conserved protein
MKVLVTVGTTPFDSLIRFCDENMSPDLDLTLQLSDKGVYLPKRFRFFRFADNITEYYDESDVVVTHAGAGTVFSLLEMGKRIIVVPNLDRDDGHQKDLAKEIAQKRWGLVCWELDTLPRLIQEVTTCELAPYERRKFSGGPLINAMIRKLYFGDEP